VTLMPRNPNNPRRRFATDEERKQAIYLRRKAWREANPEKARASVTRFHEKNPTANADAHLRRKYGIGVVDMDVIIELQGGSCAICRGTDPRRKNGTWTVDHDHRTGKVRGIVCHPCNAAMGMVDDNTETLRRMIDYLERARDGVEDRAGTGQLEPSMGLPAA